MRERDLTLDLMKGLAIFLVVFGHVTGVTSGQSQYPLRSLIFSIHMPLFFFVSGYLVSRKLESANDIKHFVVKRMRLLLPLIVFGTIDIIFYDEEWAKWDGFFAWSKFGLWFFFVLFCFNTVYALCQYLLRGNNNVYIEISTLVLPAIIGVVLRKFQHTEIGNALNFINAYNYSFFVMGIILKRYGLEWLARRNDVGIFLIGIYSFGLYTGYPIFNIPMKGAGVLLVFSIFKGLVERNMLTTAKLGGVISMAGKNSLYIYILHYYLLRTLHILPKNILEFIYSSPMYHLIFIAFISICIMALSIAAAKCLSINAYIRKYGFGIAS